MTTRTAQTLTRPRPGTRPLRTLATAVLGVVALAGCSRFDHLGKPPTMSNVADPAEQEEAKLVSMPMPALEPDVRQPNSLWKVGSTGFLRDLRAKDVGDILTVLIDIDDQAQIRNQTNRSRTSGESLGVPNFLGLESRLPGILPDAVDPENLFNLGATSNSGGSGSVNRQEDIQLKVAAVVTQRLPNGNLVVAGRQEVRVNFELRELRIAGVIRPEDISTRNTIGYEKIAEARISYGGRGQITDVQQPRYGQQVLDIILPF